MRVYCTMQPSQMLVLRLYIFAYTYIYVYIHSMCVCTYLLSYSTASLLLCLCFLCTQLIYAIVLFVFFLFIPSYNNLKMSIFALCLRVYSTKKIQYSFIHSCTNNFLLFSFGYLGACCTFFAFHYGFVSATFSAPLPHK